MIISFSSKVISIPTSPLFDHYEDIGKKPFKRDPLFHQYV